MNGTLSLFSGGHRDVHPRETSEEQLVYLIAHDISVSDLTLKHRQFLLQDHPKEAHSYKSRLPCYAVAVTFEGGKTHKHITGYTGLSLCDADHLSPDEIPRLLEILRRDRHTRMAYVTASGAGLRILFAYRLTDGTSLDTLHRTDAQKAAKLYTHVFGQGNEYFRQLLGLESLDKRCKDCTRISGVAHCPEVYYNPQSEPLAIDPPAEEANALPPKRKIHRATLEAALPAVESTLRERGVDYVPGSRNAYISQAGYLLNQYGVPCDDTVKWAEETFTDYIERPVADIILSCYKQTDEYGRLKLASKNRNHRATINDLRQYLKSNDIQIRRNVITRKQEIFIAAENQWKELTNIMVNSLYCHFCSSTGMRAQINDLHILINSDFYPEYHPLHHYLHQLPPWNGTDYIEAFASRVHVANCPQERHNRFFKKWLVGMIAGWVEDDKSNHEILTYIGKQGIYKSTFMRMILPPELQEYFSAKNFAQRLTRDDKLELTEKALVALEELDHLSAAEVNQLKAVVGNPYINERAVYDRYKERRCQLASFCGTGNNPRFLTDLTENRRWLPFVVESIESPYQNQPDYTGIYSQAYALWKDGFAYWFSADENKELEAHNRAFEAPSLEEDLILTHYRKPQPGEAGEFRSTADILSRINAGLKHPLSAMKLSLLLSKLGFEKVRATNNRRGFRVYEFSYDEINANKHLMSHPEQGTLDF